MQEVSTNLATKGTKKKKMELLKPKSLEEPCRVETQTCEEGLCWAGMGICEKVLLRLTLCMLEKM